MQFSKQGCIQQTRGGVQTITTITTIIITITRIMVAEALGKTNFPTMLSGVLRGRRKGDPNTSVVGKRALRALYT